MTGKMIMKKLTTFKEMRIVRLDLSNGRSTSLHCR